MGGGNIGDEVHGKWHDGPAGNPVGGGGVGEGEGGGREFVDVELHEADAFAPCCFHRDHVRGGARGEKAVAVGGGGMPGEVKRPGL